jgi:hypothetical protein
LATFAHAIRSTTPTAPEAVAQDHDRGRSGRFVGWHEIAPKHGGHAEQPERVRGHVQIVRSSGRRPRRSRNATRRPDATAHIPSNDSACALHSSKSGNDTPRVKDGKIS